MQKQFTDFLRQREVAAKAYVAGDPEPLLALSASADPATFFGPNGVSVTGADAVRRSYAAGARQFGSSGTSHFEILHSGSDGRIGYWTGFQHATVMMAGGAEVPMLLRVTELFCHQGDGWMLIHRHADTASTGQG
jgi:ketosteroid isomerase-like protein